MVNLSLLIYPFIYKYIQFAIVMIVRARARFSRLSAAATPVCCLSLGYGIVLQFSVRSEVSHLFKIIFVPVVF